jgi:hypothetical protein
MKKPRLIGGAFLFCLQPFCTDSDRP